MAKRKSEPEEAIDPAVDGLRELELVFDPVLDLPVEKEDPSLPEIADNMALMANPTVLIFGNSPDADAVADLAAECGFSIERVSDAESAADCYVPDFERIVEICGIDRNYFICVFLDDVESCELVLSQCLASDAYYLGLYGDKQKCREVFERLRHDGVPDAELAPIAAPIGLDIGAETPWQSAVAIVAEMLAVKAGKLVGSRHKK